MSGQFTFGTQHLYLTRAMTQAHFRLRSVTALGINAEQWLTASRLKAEEFEAISKRYGSVTQY